MLDALGGGGADFGALIVQFRTVFRDNDKSSDKVFQTFTGNAQRGLRQWQRETVELSSLGTQPIG